MYSYLNFYSQLLVVVQINSQKLVQNLFRHFITQMKYKSKLVIIGCEQISNYRTKLLEMGKKKNGVKKKEK